MIEGVFPARKRFTNLGPWPILPILLFSLSLPVANLIAQGTNQAGSSAVVAKYMSAFQKRDIKAIIDNTYNYQREVAQIKAQNPQALWPKLIAEYYAKKTAALSQAPGYWQNYTESVLGMSGDPAQGIRSLFGLIPHSSKWAITEARPGPQGTTVYVTVNYPDISEAPIAGPQVLKQTILNFTLSTPPTLIVAMQKVSKADVFWTGGPDLHTAMAKRYLAAGLWDAAISQLEPLESASTLSADGRGLLASAYLQHVTQQCFERFVNGPKIFVRFKDDNQCMSIVTKALALNPNLKRVWVNQLLSNANASLEAEQPDSASSLLRLASQFSGGDSELEALSGKLRLEAAGQYIHWAVYNFAHQNNRDSVFVQGNVRSARELVPNVLESEAGLEMVKQRIREAVDSKAREGDALANNYFFGILDFMQTYRITIPSQELPEFLNWANQTSAPADWQRRVKELAAPTGALTPAAGVQPSPGAPVSAPLSNAPAICSDYNNCLKNGNDALRVARWNEAIANFHHASSLEPSKQAPLALLAMANLSAGQDGEVASAWDKILQIGQSIGLGVCRERAIRGDSGTLFLSSKEISFRDQKNQTVFAVPPSDVTSLGAQQYGTEYGYAPFFGLRIAGKVYRFDFFPPGITCNTQSPVVQCPDAGRHQQIVVDNYVAQTIPKLASGVFKSQPTETPPISSQPVAALVGGCGDYRSCLSAGNDAVRSSNWDQALAHFQRASSLEPANPEAWNSRGKVYLATGRNEQASAMWDKALSLGGPVTFVVCHMHASSCQSDLSDRGELSLEPKQVSFITSSGKRVFAVSPSDVTSADVSFRRRYLAIHELDLKIVGKNYNFYLVPFGVDCGKEETAFCEDDKAVAQQFAVFNYISHAIPRLASGAFKP
jgi:tetratricopeptide (TPR) repeat protein